MRFSAERRVVIASVILIAFLATVAFVVYCGQRIYGTIGPSRAFSAADGKLYVLSHGHIHVFGADGKRLQTIDLAALGVHPRPSDFEVHSDGRIVTTDPNTSVLNRCQVPDGPCEQIDVGLKTVVAQDVRRLNAAKIHIDEAARRYYVSDNAGHSVIIADFEGRLLARSAPGAFRYPNQLWIDPPGVLSVVDTGNQRRVTIDITGDRFGPTISVLPTYATKLVRPGRYLPFDSVVLPNGETWVLIARTGMRDADIIAFDAKNHALRRIDMGEDSDPFDIESWGGKVWVADATRYRFEPVSFSPQQAPGPTLDPAFYQELAQARESPERWKMIRAAAQAMLILLPIFGIFIMRRK
jgi:hypothetical protein